MSTNYVKNRLGHKNRLHAKAKKAKKDVKPEFNNSHNEKAELLEQMKQKQISKQLEETK